jgi:hypothetical protein
VFHRVVVDGGPIVEIEKVKRPWRQHHAPRVPAAPFRIYLNPHHCTPLLKTDVTGTESL